MSLDIGVFLPGGGVFFLYGGYPFDPPVYWRSLNGPPVWEMVGFRTSGGEPWLILFWASISRSPPLELQQPSVSAHH